MNIPPNIIALLPLALKEEPIINAERYLSAVGFSVLFYDHFLTFGDEVRYIWRRPITSIKVLYLILRYGVAIAQFVYFQAISGLTTHLTHNFCIGSLIVLAIVGSMSLILANYIMLIRVYTLWDHRKWMLRTLYVGYGVSVCATIAFVATSIVQLQPHVLYDPYLFRMCLITGRSQYWIGIWLSQALFDIFLFILTLFNAASRPRRANVKIITDLRRDGCVFYGGLFIGRFLNVALSIPTSKQYYLIAVSFVLSLSTVSVTRLVLRVERLLVDRGASRDLRMANWMCDSYELQSSSY
ncbi:hypothetical protein B0F90DRAFT_1736669 [Multifurca ochricompacta]|uniref:DUF6533 domain-containing protein n=1 Tax=Multifurca ochricompacta TaxID=376703 RepID=A0AAD4M1I3_9AGAM|nr:hypothetical protein B0F90DRAFT_1736669 [Multifurca ochricompacta]